MEKKILEAEEEIKIDKASRRKNERNLTRKECPYRCNKRLLLEGCGLKRKQQEAEEKTAVMKEKGKPTVKLPKLDPKNFDGNNLKQTEFWDASQVTIHNNKGLHVVDKLSI